VVGQAEIPISVYLRSGGILGLLVGNSKENPSEDVLIWIGGG
jgi:hypothetical protein